MKKPKDLSSSEGEECDHGEGVGVYDTLLQSDTVQTCGCAKEDTRPVGDGLRKKPKDLSGSEREDRVDGESVSMGDVCESSLFTYDIVCSQKTIRLSLGKTLFIMNRFVYYKRNNKTRVVDLSRS